MSAILEMMRKIRNFFKEEFIILALILLTFTVKFILSYLPSFDIDMGTWLAWAQRLAGGGPWKFYSDIIWTQYTPGFLYWLWLLGKTGFVNALSVKLPVIIAEIATGMAIWSIIRKVNKRFAYLAFLLYALNPVVLFSSSVWGQIDGILALFLFLSVYFLTFREKPELSGFFWGLSFLIKPQAFALLPAIAFILFIKRFSFKKVVKFAVVSLTTLFVLGLPFFPQNPIFGLPQLILKMGSYYSYTSIFAFNFWSVFFGMWKPDSLSFLGVSLFSWGMVLYLLSLVLIFFIFRKKKEVGNFYLLMALSLFAFFLFPTRVHDRYIFPVFVFLLTAAGLLKSRKILIAYGLLSIFNFINLYYSYAYYTDNFLRNSTLLKMSGNLAPVIGVASLLIFLILLIDKFSFKRIQFMNEKVIASNSKKILIGILVFAFIGRIFELGNPPNEYFDEVYHAFTARQMLHGNPRAWEWWNTPPPGFAYEWTHPPLAKELMVIGMKIFGENSFGWRIPGAILGVGISYLVYKIGKELFNDEAIGLLSAAVFSLDGLALVMSRIGMNDTYFLFFALLAVYFYIKDRNLLSAISFGLSMSSKWSAIWAIPIFLLLHFVLKKKFKLSYLWFLLLPFTIYLLTYLPMFISGHTWANFVEMQKQMWWYHTRLRATHPYTSAWWSWPILLRPVYLYTSGVVGDKIANIYAIGNPAIFWFGIFSVAMAAIISFIEKNKRLGLIIFSYIIFFVPWAASPRIMFIYHYLPSIAFLAIATGYVLRRFPRIIFAYLFICLLMFIYFYPHWAGLKIPVGLDNSYYWFASWR